jgi:TolB-like protein/DNA-binding winged helix-turn-helix (wHTH) protein/Tfp pilus assembly protein PilF
MQAADRFILGSFEVRPDQNLIAGPDGDHHIEPRAMALLLELVAAEGRTVPREELIRAVWSQQFVTDDALNGCVSQLRRAFRDDPRAPRYIATVPKVGYRLVQPRVSADREEDSSSGPAENGSKASDELPANRAPSLRDRLPPLSVTGLILVAVALAVASWFALRGTRPLAGASTAAPASENGVAVLPFSNLSDDEANAFFARGMQEEILSDLARLADLKVISRTSVTRYQGSSDRSMRDIARTLGVRYVIEGSVQRVDDRIRVTVQLIDAPLDKHLWADHYDRRVTDVFAIQSEIAENIADHLRARLSAREQATLRRAPTTDLEAYELYDSARSIFVWNDFQGAESSLKRKKALLERAIERDPNFALAYCALAKAQEELGGFDEDRVHLRAAKSAVDTALRLQPDLGDAHRELGRYYYAAGELDRGYDELLAVSQAWPNDAETFRLLGEIDRERNRWDQAVAHLRRATELDPRNGEYTYHLQLVYRRMHRYDEGLRFIADAFAREPENPEWKWLYLAEYRLAAGEPGGAQQALGHLPMSFSPTSEIWYARFRTALYQRDYDDASRIVASTPSKWASYLFTGQPPRSWADGVLARLQGDRKKAREIFASVRAKMETTRARGLRYPRYWYLTEAAQVDAELGRKSKAIDEATTAVELAPRRSPAHQRMIQNLALVYALVGERDRAIEQLESISKIPAGPTYGDLRFNPLWDPLRESPSFQRLVAALAPGSGANEE